MCWSTTPVCRADIPAVKRRIKFQHLRTAVSVEMTDRLLLCIAAPLTSV